MIAPEKFVKENERLKSLKSYSIIDTLPESDFDNITTIAAGICNTPISLVTLIDDDRQWFKSHYGLNATETPRDFSFCAHAINEPDTLFEIQDSRKDERFYDNPFVTGEPNIIFYAGVPLIGEDGLPLGTLCVIDHKPKLLNEVQKKSLKSLAQQVTKLLELRKNKIELEESVKTIQQANTDLEKFAYIAAHDLRSPLCNIISLTKMFSDIYGSSMEAEGLEIIELIENSSKTLNKLIEGLLEYSKSDKVIQENKLDLSISELKSDIISLLTYDDSCQITFTSELDSIYTNKTALEQILINLVANAIKYNDKPISKIEIKITEENNFYKFSVNDNGPGILPEHHDKIFEIFSTVSKSDKFGDRGNGIGLATVKKLVELLNGKISVESEIGKSTNFIFTIEKN